MNCKKEWLMTMNLEWFLHGKVYATAHGRSWCSSDCSILVNFDDGFVNEIIKWQWHILCKARIVSSGSKQLIHAHVQQDLMQCIQVHWNGMNISIEMSAIILYSFNNSPVRDGIHRWMTFSVIRYRWPRPRHSIVRMWRAWICPAFYRQPLVIFHLAKR